MKGSKQALSQMFSEMKKINQLIKQIDWPHINAPCDPLGVWKKNE
ncbi:TPA: hypothetical protein ACXYK5_002723 [Legionella pneumophila]